MTFDHHKLEVYQRALKSLEMCDQIERAASSIVANVAEGAGDYVELRDMCS